MTNKFDEDSRERMLLAYLRGELDEQDVRNLRNEVTDDEEYAERLEHLLLGVPDKGQETPAPFSLTEKQQRAILTRGKWKMRFTNSAFTFVIFFLIGALLLLVNGWVGMWVYKDQFKVTEDIINFTQPGVSTGSSGSQVGLLYGQIQMELREQVGAEQQNVGYVESTNFLWSVRAEPKWANGVRETKLFFRYPTEEAMTREDTDYLRAPAWNTMSKLHEGTVSQLAISFDRPMTYEEYIKLISKHVPEYNLDTLWFAVDTGVEAKEREQDGNLLLSAGEVWGYAERGLDYGNAPIQVNGEGDRRAAAYLAEMKYLSEHGSLAREIGRGILSRSDPKVEERYAYLKEKGVRIYGAVVTGPTKELLKLEAEKAITAAFLGKVDWWNWERPAASGTQLNW
ncbi:anti-sigma factor [Brevibacillus centrosporus]|uniref:anti-sigma factor n=1 Tax=Brevibacillus centrosporus TaxID=54910 RepID=UPI000F0A813F|nr:anti-sigma factor [Brevibacillus centrosporus]MEC2131748.1 anti-sigma factor [Brevibacillus centrosporus]RNB67395.1 anti-sigma factor [Brevibacillus centrosporus]GED34750.1 hypothetical protein BCE02nite_58910 [Brevibacillus centrosporus]